MAWKASLTQSSSSDLKNSRFKKSDLAHFGLHCERSLRVTDKPIFIRFSAQLPLRDIPAAVLSNPSHCIHCVHRELCVGLPE